MEGGDVHIVETVFFRLLFSRESNMWCIYVYIIWIRCSLIFVAAKWKPELPLNAVNSQANMGVVQRTESIQFIFLGPWSSWSFQLYSLGGLWRICHWLGVKALGEETTWEGRATCRFLIGDSKNVLERNAVLSFLFQALSTLNSEELERMSRLIIFTWTMSRRWTEPLKDMAVALRRTKIQPRQKLVISFAVLG